MTVSLPPADALRAALAGLLDGLPPRQAAQAVERLIGTYRGDVPTEAAVLRGRPDAVAYAAYRMPATFEAVRAALTALALSAPGWAPRSHLDVGGGTGAAVWAARAVWDEPAATTVLDRADAALDIGRELAGAAGIGGVEWRGERVGSASGFPEADLLTICYVLNELPPGDRSALIDEAARVARAVAVVEPGTPGGYERIMEVRERLLAAGMTIAAPCPHGGACPVVPGADWCHFAARVARSSVHRQVKGGSLAYEDEKFSYVVGVRFAAQPAASRVVRRPQIRKGQVLLDLCDRGEGLRRDTVSKRHGPLYRAARDAAWGEAWPPGDDDPAEDAVR